MKDLWLPFLSLGVSAYAASVAVFKLDEHRVNSAVGFTGLSVVLFGIFVYLVVHSATSRT